MIALDLRCCENNLDHRTKLIDKKRLIVRRGQPFLISLHCSESKGQSRQHSVDMVLHLSEYNPS